MKRKQSSRRAAKPTVRPGRGWLYPTVLVAAAAAVYSNSFAIPFVFDDTWSIVENQHIRVLWPLEISLTAPPQSPVSGRPLVSLSLALNYAFGGLDVRGYHAVNVAIHALCSLALFGCVRRTLRMPALSPRYGQVADELAFATALLWVVHPLTTETVNYVTQRTESLMALCYLLTLYASIRATETRKWGAWHSAAVLSCALGMAAKEVMVTAPFMIALYDVCFSDKRAREVLHERRHLYFGLAAGWLLLAVLNVSGPRSASVGTTSIATSFNYALNQCVMLARYVRLTVWPSPLVLDYGMPQDLSIGQVLPQAAFLLTLLGATIYALWRHPRIGFLGAWFFIILSPTSSVIPIWTEVGADRRPYLPLAGAIVLYVVVAWSRLAGRDAPWRERGFRVGVLAAAIALGALTLERNRDYQTKRSIWQSSVAAAPHNARSRTNLGLAFIDTDPATAEDHLRQALRIDSDYVPALINLGDSLRMQGQHAQAIPILERALELEPGSANAHNTLGSVLGSQGRVDQAIRQFELAIEAEPYSAAAHANLGFALSLSNRAQGAIEHYRLALQFGPSAETHYKLANTLLGVGQQSQALFHLREAARLKPGWSPPLDRIRSLTGP